MQALDPLHAPIGNSRRPTPCLQAVQRGGAACAEGMGAPAIRALIGRFLDWRQQRFAVARLAALDDRSLKDMGIHRSEIEAAVRGGVHNR